MTPLLFYLHGHYWFIWEEIIILMPKPMTNLFKLKMDGKTGQDGNIIVYQDTPFKDSPRLMEIDGKSEKGYITIHTYDQENSASPQVLKRVINDVTRLYPAKSYGLIVFSHGSGWLPPHTLVNGSRSIIIDNDNEMEITDFARASRTIYLNS